MTRFALREIAYTYDAEAGASEENWSFEAETFGTPGETLPIPVGQMDDPEYVGLPPHRPIRSTQYRLLRHIISVPTRAYTVYLCTRYGVYVSKNFFGSSPTWTEVITPDRCHPDAVTFQQFALDPHNTRSAAYVKTSVSGGALICRLTGMGGIAYSSSLWYDSSNLYGSEHFCVSPRIPGAMWVVAKETSTDEIVVWRRGSYTGSFFSANVGGPTGYSICDPRIGSGYYGSSLSNTTVNVRYLNYDGFYHDEWYRSVDGGATFALVDEDNDVYRAVVVNVPYNNSGDDDIVIVAGQLGLPGSVYGMRRRNADTSVEYIVPNKWGLLASTYNIDKVVVYPLDPNIIYALIQDESGGFPYSYKLVRTTTGGGTDTADWDEITPPGGIDLGIVLHYTGIVGWPSDPGFLMLAHKDGLFWTSDALTTTNPTWNEGTGNIEDVIGDTLWIKGIVSLVPSYT